MNPKHSRSSFLRASGKILTLPVLSSLQAKPKSPPRRILFLGFGWGVTNETWYPDKTKTGSDYPLPEGLKALSRHKKDFSIIQGCQHQYSNEAHWGSTFWLTGANRYGIPGKSFSNTISADQVAAKAFGPHTRFSSLQLNSRDVESSGHGPGLSMAWDQQGKPLAGKNTPFLVYHQLFSADQRPVEEMKQMLIQKRSLLDTFLIDAKRLQNQISQHDKHKLNEYFESIRDIETQLGKEEKWMHVPKSKAPFSEPSKSISGLEEIKLMYKLIITAFQTDNTRVITYRQPVHNLLKSLGITVAPHDMSHYTPGARMQASQKRDHTQSELLSGLFDQLKNTKESDGSSLFDHTTLAYGSNIRSIHYLNNCPTLIAGRGAGLRLGQHHVLPDKTPLCNVWLTMLQGLGLNIKSHGDSCGPIKEIVA